MLKVFSLIKKMKRFSLTWDTVKTWLSFAISVLACVALKLRPYFFLSNLLLTFFLLLEVFQHSFLFLLINDWCFSLAMKRRWRHHVSEQRQWPNSREAEQIFIASMTITIGSNNFDVKGQRQLCLLISLC